MMGLTPLDIAVNHGDYAIARALLDADANPNVTRDTGTVLCRAVDRGLYAVVEILVEAKADINANCDFESSEMSNLTPLRLATEKRQSAIVEILVDAGARR